MGKDLESHQDHGLALEEARPEVTLPPMYRVVLINDDYTPMDFVIEILKTFFAMSHDRATQVMLHVHTKGKGVCGVFTFEILQINDCILITNSTITVCVRIVAITRLRHHIGYLPFQLVIHDKAFRFRPHNVITR